MRENEKKRVWWKALLKRSAIPKTANVGLSFFFFYSLACFAHGHTDGAWTLSALNNTRGFFISKEIPIISAEERGLAFPRTYKYPITTC